MRWKRAFLRVYLHEALLGALDQTSPADVAFGAQLVVAYFLALRTEDHTDGRLHWGDVFAQDDGSVEFLLPPGKSVRRFRRVAIAAKSKHLSAVAHLAEFLPEGAKQPECPVFISFELASRGVPSYPPLSRSKFIARFKALVGSVLGYSPALYAGYSLRRGGVTEMLTVGVPAAVVKRHVGWVPTSEAICSYYDHAGRLQMRLPTRMMGVR